MAHVATIGTGTATTAVSSLAVTLTAGAAVGHTVIGAVVWESTAGTIPTVSSITDTRGHTWTVDVSAGGSGNVATALAVFRTRVTTALQTGDTVTINISSGTRSRWAAQLDDFNDVNTSPLDQFAHSDNPAQSTSLATGATATTAQAYELAVAAFGYSGSRTVTIPSGWSGGAQVTANPGSSIRSVQVIWQYTSATGAEQGTLTLDTASAYCAAIATYKATNPAPPVAHVSQVKLQVPTPGTPAVARVSQVKLQIPTAAVGVVRIAQVKFRVPTAPGQAPYSGIKAAIDGTLQDAAINAARDGSV